MSKKKSKFDLTHLVKDGVLKEGDILEFVSDPKKTCRIVKHPSGEYKIQLADRILTLHQLATEWLQMEPPGHAAKWFKTKSGSIVFDLWQQDLDQAA